ncbi:DUF3916 domain-containing protein [Fertoebacter nigrum]|uniref:DUF3916 domain-containing protein n=1 Tax=Fertoeibacter niger TaxID=2656921 RepID=A0A8X8KNP3_9RHOB|nr:DUF3916 domain-containing protein [Fertoeibacter niger]NUB45215.1 DUF3916 domain-containing protein [Fertoeibacter niger]
MRRFDLRPAKKLRGRARQERAFHAAMDGMAGWFPDRALWDGDFAQVKLPGFAKAYGTRHGSAAFRAAVVGRLVGTAAAVAGNRPGGCRARVAALIDWPELWGSEICVFFDAAQAKGFSPEHRATHRLPSRTTWDGGWVEASAPDEDLLARTGTALPTGFAAHGTQLREHHSDSGLTFVREEWVVMETATSEGILG